MQCMGTSYEGCILNESRMEDLEATYRFPDHFASEYQGGIVDGMFHGEGKLKFIEGVNFTGKFEKGRTIEGFFEFQDDVRFENENWVYCDGDSNRVFKSEQENGFKPAGRSQLTNVDPPQTIPEGMYDCGDGFYDPVKRKVTNYRSGFLRNTDEKEHQWIINRCRKARDEPVGSRKVH